MIGKPVAFIQVPNQRLFSTGAAAKYLGKHPNTIRKMADLGVIEARVETDSAGRQHRAFTLEVLDAYIESLQRYDSAQGEEPGARKGVANGYM